MTLLEPKIEKSPTCCKFENFDPEPQLDIKIEIPKKKPKRKKKKEKMTLFEPKIEKSPTCCKLNLKILTQTPNLTSNFETHNNVGDNFYFVCKYIYT